MALSTLEGVIIDIEIGEWLLTQENPGIRSVMIAAGRTGAAAKAAEVATEVTAVLTALYGTTAPTRSP
jgi:hypothetical protein